MIANVRRRALKLALAQVSALVCASSAMAQAADENALSEVIVTAQKRAENVRDVPLAINAFSGETLQQANVVQLFDLQRLAPSLRVDNGARADKPRIVIRGIGSSGGTAIEPSVATFLDGIYMPREGATLATYLDIEAVEVLRGPQGTLFGRNASVGAISLRSATPKDETSARVTAEVGSGDRVKLNGFVNAKVSDRVTIRFAGLADMFQGLYKNQLTNSRVGGINTTAGRLSVKAELSDSVTDTLRVAYSRRKGNDYFTPYLLLPNTFPAGGLTTYLARFASIGSNHVDLTPFDKTINQYVDDELSERQGTISNELTYTAAGGAQIKLISGFNRWNITQRGNHIFGAETSAGVQLQHTRSKSHQEELQLISPDNFIADGLSAVAGLYYFNEKLLIDEDFQVTRDMCRLAIPTNPLFASCVANSGIPATDVGFTQSTDSFAAYAQGTYKFSPTLDLTLGLRWSKDEKDALFTARPVHPIGALFTGTETTPLKLDQSRVTYRANLTWRPTDEAMLFASYTTGFKSGGFNSAASGAVLGARRNLQPETVESYELGAKTAWLNDRLRLDVVAYLMDVTNFQDRSFTGIGFAVTNAGGIRNKGVEIELTARPTDGFKLSSGVAYLDSEFTSYPGASNLPGLAGTQNLKGTRPTFTPKWSGNVAGEFDGDLGSSGMRWALRGDVSFSSKANIGGVNDNNPDTVQGGYALLGARATIRAADGGWSASVFGSNLADKGYCTSLAYQPFGVFLGAQAGGHAALRCNIVGTPRTFGASVTVGF